jgi:hypothetical protein
MWSLRSGFEHCPVCGDALRAFCPRAFISRPVPDGIQFRLSIDFARARKIGSGGLCRDAFVARQNLPAPGSNCRAIRQKIPLFGKCARPKGAEMLEKPVSARSSTW